MLTVDVNRERVRVAAGERASRVGRKIGGDVLRGGRPIACGVGEVGEIPSRKRIPRPEDLGGAKVSIILELFVLFRILDGW